MRSNDIAHEGQKQLSSISNPDSQQFGGVTRRRLLSAGAAGVAGLGVLGSAGSAAAAKGEHTLVIEGFGDSSINDTQYSFTVGNNLEKSKADGATINHGDSITRQSAHGRVIGGTDAYTFDGDLLAFDFEPFRNGSINVLLDGQPAHVGQRPDHFLQIQGQGPYTTYRFTVSDNLKKSTAGGGTINREDQITNHNWSASGAVGGGTDAYTFDGDLHAFDFNGEVNVLLDGRPAHVGQHPDHFLQIQGQGPYTTYSFTVSNNLKKSTAGGGTINHEDQITNRNRSASGAVGGGTDAYTFDGDLRAFDFDGKVNVLLDGQPAHVGQRPDSVGSSPPQIVWSRVYNRSHLGKSPQALVKTSDGGYAFAGTIQRTDTDDRGIGWLVKTDQKGKRQWGKRFSFVNIITDLVETHDHGFALVGSRDEDKHRPYAQGRMIKTDSEGTTQWRRRLGTTPSNGAPEQHLPMALRQTHDGGYTLGGALMLYSHHTPLGGWAARLDSTGHVKWSRTYTQRPGDGFNDWVRTRDGGYLFVGATGRHDNNYTLGWMVKTDRRGHEQWRRATGRRDSTFKAVRRGSNGGYILAGYNPEGKASWLLKITEEGKTVWQRGFGSIGGIVALTCAPDGGYVFVDSRHMRKVDLNGHLEWQKKIDDTSFNTFPADLVSVSKEGYVELTTKVFETFSGPNDPSGDITTAARLVKVQ